jgi:preprotein translocase subunit SecG
VVIGEQDNARLLANLIVWSRGGAGTVIFDDAHQGAVTYYDAKAFFKDPRLHRTIAWMVLLWFVFVLGIQRLRSRQVDWNPVDVTAFVAGSGEFFAATLTSATAGARLLANFFNSIRCRLGLVQDGTPEWEWLSAQAGVAARDLEELRRLHERAQAGRSVDLVRLQNLLVRLHGNFI